MVRPYAVKGRKRKKNKTERYDKEEDEEDNVEEVEEEEEVENVKKKLKSGVNVQQQGNDKNSPGVIFILKKTSLEVGNVGKSYQLLNSEDHANFLRKNNRNPAEYRPDISHQAILNISPLNILDPTPGPSSSSSSSAEEAVVQPWLGLIDDERDIDRLEVLLRRKFETPRTLCWTTLDTLHLAGRAREMIGHIWERLFAIRQPVYQELCYEFFATLEFRTTVRDVTFPRALVFRLGGVKREMSLAEFAVRMRLYTPEEVELPIFTEALFELPDGVTAGLYWPEIANGVYIPKKSKATSLHDPLLRILHRAITSSINGRRESTGVVTTADMFYLYCFTAPATGNVAYRLANYLYEVAGKKANSSICGGSFVTQLAHSYGTILTSPHMAVMKEHPITSLIDIAVLTRMAVIREREQRGGYQLLDGRGRPWPPQEEPEQEQEMEEQPHDEDPHEAAVEPAGAPARPPPPPPVSDQLLDGRGRPWPPQEEPEQEQEMEEQPHDEDPHEAAVEPTGAPAGPPPPPPVSDQRWERRWERMVAYQEWVADSLQRVIAHQEWVANSLQRVATALLADIPAPPALRSPPPQKQQHDDIPPPA